MLRGDLIARAKGWLDDDTKPYMLKKRPRPELIVEEESEEEEVAHFAV